MGIYRLARTLDKEANIVLNPKGENLAVFLEELKSNPEYENIILEPQKAMSEVDVYKRQLLHYIDLVFKHLSQF